MGVEYPVANDPTKLHGVVTEDGVSMWRWECMCCGSMGQLHDAPSVPRAIAIRHANSAAHRVLLKRVRKEQSW